MFDNLFNIPISVLEKILRPILVYFVLLAFLRIFGKRELAQLNPFDLTVLMMLSNTVQNAIIGNDNSLLGGLIGALTLLATNYLVVRVVSGHKRLDQIVSGSPTLLIENGKVLKESLRKELVTEGELKVAANRQGVTHLADVKRCTLEAGGIFNFDVKEESTRDRHYADLSKKLDTLTAQIENLSARLPQ